MQPNTSWPDARPALSPYRSPSRGKAIWQLTNTMVPYAGLWCLMILSIRHDFSYWWTLALSVVAAGFLVRLLGVLVFTPFDDWRLSHLRHHVSYANLDTRGFGAIFNFMLSNRLPSRKVQHKQRMSVVLTDLAIVGVFLVAAQTIGWQTYLLIQLPVLWLAGMGGIWLFYVQHQFEGGYWARKGEWDPLRAAMEGSSYYQLPNILRWFSANIGYHHIHHLNARIPNYRLPECYNEVPAVRARKPLTLRQSLTAFRVKLWDESQGKMIAFP